LNTTGKQQNLLGQIPKQVNRGASQTLVGMNVANRRKIRQGSAVTRTSYKGTLTSLATGVSAHDANLDHSFATAHGLGLNYLQNTGVMNAASSFSTS